MKIFIIGDGGVGKSTLAKRLCASLPRLKHVSPSADLRLSVARRANDTDRVYRRRLIDESKRLMQVNRYHFMQTITSQFEPGRIPVIDGMRNPLDFAKLYDPDSDMVIIVGPCHRHATDTDGKGVSTIYDIVDLAGQLGRANNVVRYGLRTDEQYDDVLALVLGHIERQE